MKRKTPKDFVIGEPASFAAIVASPESQAEFEELEKFKRSEHEEFNYQVLRLRKFRWEQDQKDRAQYGDRYEERLKIRAAIKSEVCDWVKPMAKSAIDRGFCNLRCDTRYDVVRLQFADENGTYFQRSVSLRRFEKKHGVSLGLHEYWEIGSAIDSEVRSSFGMGISDHGRRRVSAVQR